MRRIIGGLIAFLTVTGTILVLPVYAAPLPDAAPVKTSVDEVALGSVVDPAGAAVVATDGEVQPNGARPDGAQVPVSEAPVSGGEDAVVSGDELPGVPALTVSRPETEEFSTVGITWRNDPSVTEVVAQVRVKDADGRWGEWTTMEMEDSEQGVPGGTADLEVRSGTAPYWTGAAYGVEAIVQGADGAVPEDVRLTLLDPGDSAADDLPDSTGPQDQADAALAMPRVFSRAEWGADESIMTWGPQYAPTIKAAALHHTTGSSSYRPEDVPGMLRSIYAYHAQTRNWGDIGYNVVVDKFGRIFEGRAGGLTSTVAGAHIGGFNSGTFGVAMLGDYEKAIVPQATVDAVSAIIAWKFDLYGADPAGTVALTSPGTPRFPAGTVITLPTVFGHRDLGQTTCAGKYGYARLGEIRKQVLARSDSAPFVRGLYADMMVRPADDGGLATWTTALSAGRDRRAVSWGFANSIEYRTLSIRQAYQQVFERAPDPSGMTTWLGALKNGFLGLDNLRPTLMASQEFYLRGGSSDTAFVENIYRAALGRSAAPAEVDYWADVRRSRGAQAVIGSVWGSPEAAMRRVSQAYEYYLGRSAGRPEQEYWLPVVMGAGDERLREEVVISWEYMLRSTSRFP